MTKDEFLDKIDRDRGMEPGQRSPQDVFLDAIWPERHHDVMYEQAMLDMLRRVGEKIEFTEELDEEIRKIARIVNKGE